MLQAVQTVTDSLRASFDAILTQTLQTNVDTINGLVAKQLDAQRVLYDDLRKEHASSYGQVSEALLGLETRIGQISPQSEEDDISADEYFLNLSLAIRAEVPWRPSSACLTCPRRW